MTSGDLRHLDIMPFDSGVMADCMDGHATEEEEKAQFAVMLRYLDLLARQMGIPFEIPLMNICLKRQGCYSGAYCDFRKSRTEIMRRLYDSIMLGAGWSYGMCRIGSNNALQKPELSENAEIHEWERAVSMVPEIFMLQQKGFQRIVITVCWNTRVARYCKYAASHSREVEGMFGEEDASIRRILHKMADPYAVGSRIQCCQDDRYVMAYYEGEKRDVTVSPEDMDYNFFVQGIALHLFLSQAEELFGMPQYAALK